MATVEAVGAVDRLEERVYAPLLRSSRGYYLLVAVLLAIVAWGAYAYFVQVRDGLWVTGLRDRVIWGLYIALFIYLASASAGVTVVSAFLKIVHASWRAPVTRAAELVTISALITALLFILFDLGRPDRMYNIVLFSHWESPLMWDVYAVATTLMGRVIYLQLAMVRDLAMCRDQIAGSVGGLQRRFFHVFSLGWRGNQRQQSLLARASTMMTIVIVPVAVMTPIIASWIFSMTLRMPWDSPMFGIYFVSGALYSGVGHLVILLAILRRAYRLQEFITRQHFLYLGYFLAFFAALMIFFKISDFITVGYKMKGPADLYLQETMKSGMAPVFWAYFWGGLVFPLALILLPFTRNLAGIVVAAVAANVGILLEWSFVVVSGLRLPLNPYDPPIYDPSWVEWSLTAGGFALFALIVAVLLKLVPALSLYEMREGLESSAEEAASRPAGGEEGTASA